jgi:hypothetical protein
MRHHLPYYHVPSLFIIVEKKYMSPTSFFLPSREATSPIQLCPSDLGTFSPCDVDFSSVLPPASSVSPPLPFPERHSIEHLIEHSIVE